jgi:hypothetical protein
MTPTNPAEILAKPQTRKWRNWIANVLILVVTTAVFVEGAARVALSHNSLSRHLTGFDNSSYRLQWEALHQHHSEWTGEYAAYHPSRGWSLKPNIHQMPVFQGKILNSNSKGLRGQNEYPYSRTASRRILVLGDSFTFGEEVSDGETYSHKLESALPHTEVLNLGVQGYGHDQMLLYLREEGLKYRPDIVIVGFAYLDIYRNIWNFFAYAKPRYQLNSGALQLTNVPVPSPERVLSREPYRLKALDLLVMLQAKLGWVTGRNEDAARSLTRALLEAITVSTRSIGATPVFVYLPVYEEIQPLPKSSYPLTANSPPIASRQQFFGDMCRGMQAACLMLQPRFDKEVRAGADFNARGHWNAQAHSVAAEEIAAFLIQKNLVPPPSHAGLETHAR